MPDIEKNIEQMHAIKEESKRVRRALERRIKREPKEFAQFVQSYYRGHRNFAVIIACEPPNNGFGVIALEVSFKGSYEVFSRSGFFGFKRVVSSSDFTGSFCLPFQIDGAPEISTDLFLGHFQASTYLYANSYREFCERFDRFLSSRVGV